jgi:phosphate transport system permease protein
MSKAPRRKDVHAGDRIFAGSVKAMSLAIAGLLILIAVFLWMRAAPAFHKFGFAFLRTSTWDPVQDEFGALPVIFGTIVSSLIAVLIAAPMSIGIALFLNEIAPRRVANAVGFLVQMLAAIPSVVYGLWGVFVLAPWLRTVIEPFLGRTMGFLPLFQGPPYGVGMLSAGIILAIMITPTISSISRSFWAWAARSARRWP